jgi:DNA recombination protein RmuC
VNEIPLIVGLAVGAMVGGVVVWALMRAHSAAIAERLAAQQALVANCQQREAQSQSEILSQRETNTHLEREKAALQATLREERSQAAEKLAILSQAEQKLKDAFHALAAQALQSNNQQFLDLAKSVFQTEQESAKGELKQREEAIGALVVPVKDALTKFETKIQAIEVAREGAYSELRTQVQTLQQTGQQLQKEAASLASALRSSNIAGDWGQMQLRQVVKMAGMIEHCDFDEQFTTTSDDGRLRPDLVVNLPGNRRIAIDAKVPLSALLEAANAPDDEVRQLRMKDYCRNVLKHVGDLGKKEYWKQFTESPDFVVLFLPGETFFYAAQQQEPELIEMAWHQRVVIATPSTLIALLRAAASYWQQETLAKSALEISELGKELYDRLAIVADHFRRLGKNLEVSVKTYNETVGSLESRVLPSARRFRELGATTTPEDLQELEPLEVATRDFQRLELLESGQNGLESHS